MPGASTARESNPLAALCQLCQEGRLYEVEQWVTEGHPVSPGLLEGKVSPRRGSPLQIALKSGNHSLVQLLCQSGYDFEHESYSPLDIALRTRRRDLLDLLLDAGADPKAVDLDALFGTYDRGLLERFYSFGVDFSADHELAASLVYSSRNKPLYGFVKRHHAVDASIEEELQVALNSSIREGRERSIALCLWAGADPRKLSFDLASIREKESYQEDDEGEPFNGWTSLEVAAMCGNLELLKRLGPDPQTDSIDELHRCARDYQVIEYLFSIALPKEVGQWLQGHLHWFPFSSSYMQAQSGSLQIAFKAGMRWSTSSKDEIAGIRSSLLKAPNGEFVRVVREMTIGDRCSPEILKELARTSAFRKRLRDVGYLPPPEGSRERRASAYAPVGARQVLKKLGFKQPVSKSGPPGIIHIGVKPWSRGKPIDRLRLFEIVWGEPMVQIADRWGLSGRGLAKGCERAQVPVPPRGYWAKVQSGQTVRKLKLGSYRGGKEPVIMVPSKLVGKSDHEHQ